jgi:hypothetical protein
MVLAAWVAGTSRDLPSGSPEMTLITQVSGLVVGEVRAPGRVLMAPGQPPRALPHPLWVCAQAGGG